MLVLSAASPAVPPAAGDLALPLHADASLQDYVVKADVYDRRCAKTWRAGERFRMYFGSKVRRGGRAGSLLAVCGTGGTCSACVHCLVSGRVQGAAGQVRQRSRAAC